MTYFIISLCLITIMLMILSIVYTQSNNNNNSNRHSHSPSSSPSPSPSPNLNKIYKNVINANNLKSFKKNFLLDNPNGDGSDPTGGIVNYTYMFEKDNAGQIIRNINNDVYWQEISDNTPLLSEVDGKIKIDIDKRVINGKIGAPRMISRKLFRGGLFIFDIEHVPFGCGVWPALWLNGFVGTPDQYHENPNSEKYNVNMDKLLKTTINKLCSNLTAFKDKNGNPIKDNFMTDYRGMPTYVASWPMGGEFDIVEQTNFSDTNLVSIHAGPNCEVTDNYENNYLVNNSDGINSACGSTLGSSNVKNGQFSGCVSSNYEVDKSTSQTMNGETRYSCPSNAAYSAGNAQVVGPPNSFGEKFNLNKGGTYAVQWEPNNFVNIWYYSREYFTEQSLEVDNGPLSDDPNPSKWKPTKYPTKKASPFQNKKIKTLIASYNLNNPNALNSGCDFNYQGITINITLSGGWGGAVMPYYCSVQGAQGADEYIKTCISADANSAMISGNGVDPNNGCYDGAFGPRGPFSKPYFYSEAYFLFNSIKVFQTENDENVW